jgi:anti-sigma factor RsiW
MDRYDRPIRQLAASILPDQALFDPDDIVSVTFIRGELPPRDIQALAAHLEKCSTCASAAEEMRRLLHELREAWIGGESPPPEEAAIQAVGWYIRLRPLLPRRGRWGWGALLGVGLLGLGLGALLMWAVLTVGENGRTGEREKRS